MQWRSSHENNRGKRHGLDFLISNAFPSIVDRINHIAYIGQGLIFNDLLSNLRANLLRPSHTLPARRWLRLPASQIMQSSERGRLRHARERDQRKGRFDICGFTRQDDGVHGLADS